MSYRKAMFAQAKEQVLKLYHKGGLTSTQIAVRVGVNNDFVTRTIREYKIANGIIVK